MSTPTNTQPTDPHTLVLTRLEIEITLGLLDLAVKHSGLAVAANAVVIGQKLQSATPLQRLTPQIADAPREE